MKRKARVVMKDWQAGSWSEQLNRAVKREIKDVTVEIEVDHKGLEKAALRIAKEAVISYLQECVLIATKDGMEISQFDEPKVLIEWKFCACDNDVAREAVAGWVEQERERE